MTQIVDHGRWVRYQPDRLPQGAPPNALFVRRESDGVDWYDYSRDAKSFGTDSVKFTVLWQDIHNGYIIDTATREPDRLFPAGALVGEIIDYHGGEPHAELRGRLFNPDTRTLHARPVPKLVVDPVMQKLEARIAAIEAKLEIQP